MKYWHTIRNSLIPVYSSIRNRIYVICLFARMENQNGNGNAVSRFNNRNNIIHFNLFHILLKLLSIFEIETIHWLDGACCPYQIFPLWQKLQKMHFIFLFANISAFCVCCTVQLYKTYNFTYKIVCLKHSIKFLLKCYTLYYYIVKKINNNDNDIMHMQHIAWSIDCAFHIQCNSHLHWE